MIFTSSPECRERFICGVSAGGEIPRQAALFRPGLVRGAAGPNAETKAETKLGETGETLVVCVRIKIVLLYCVGV